MKQEGIGLDRETEVDLKPAGGGSGGRLVVVKVSVMSPCVALCYSHQAVGISRF